jgi:hypothetical protein
VPATVFASLANRPVALKLGFCFSTTGSAGAASSPWRNWSCCEGSGPRARRGGGDFDCEYERLLRFGGGDSEVSSFRELRSVSCLRLGLLERLWCLLLSLPSSWYLRLGLSLSLLSLSSLLTDLLL